MLIGRNDTNTPVCERVPTEVFLFLGSFLIRGSYMKLRPITPLKLVLMILVSIVAGLVGAVAYAQVGGSFDLSWNTVDGGGGTSSTGGTYSVGGTIGQPDAGSMQNGQWAVQGGFWAAAASSPTPIPTSTPVSNVLIGHVTYQGIGQTTPTARNSYPITLTLCVNGTAQNFVTTTDNQAFFTVTLPIPAGSYNWQVKSYTALSNAGSFTLNGGTTNQDFGTLRGGDTNNNNVVNTVDFNLMKANFNIPTFNAFTDFNRDGVVNTLDFNILKSNFNLPSGLLTCP